jgi:pimeloyl-ACP methyl ester carboxylesterase
MVDVLLIPGGFNGAWIWNDVANRLDNDGYQVHPLTLPGLASQAPENRRQTANLDDHIEYVIDFVSRSNLIDIIVVAHSYGGMVMHGCSAAIPEKCRGLIYVDAFVPNCGQSAWMLFTEEIRAAFTFLVSGDGRYVLPPPRSDPRSVPQPISSLLQASKVIEPPASIRRAYIAATAWRGSPFTKLYEELRANPRWETYEISASHEVMRKHSDLLAEMLSKIINGWT